MTRISSSRMDMDGGRIDNALLKNYAETLVGGTGGVNTGASYNVDLSLGNAFYLVLNAATVTFTFSNASASGTECSFTLLLKQDDTGGRAVTWPASVKWPGGQAPVVATGGGKVKVYVFTSPDNGTTWFGLPSGAEFTPGVGFPLFASGSNSFGEVGDGTNILRSSPVQVGNANNWSTTLASGSSFVMALDRTGALWGWGLNTSGQLGISNATTRSSQVQVGTLTHWVSVRSMSATTHAIDASGRLWGWGLGTTSQIGDLVATTRSSPVQIGTLTNWASVGANSPSASTAMAVNSGGQIFTWGYGTSGQLGDTSVATKSSPTQVGTLTDWATGAMGGRHMLALKTDNTLWGWGRNAEGQVGDTTAAGKSSPVQVGVLTDWASVAAGASNSMAIKTDGTLWSWGYNSQGQLGLGDLTTRSSPVQVGTLTDWLKTAPGLANVIALKVDGSLWGWGYGSRGQIGLAAAPLFSSPIQIGTDATWYSIDTAISSTVAIKTDGTLWSWGLNTGGVLGINDGTIFAASSPVQIGTLTDWASVAMGNSHAGAIKTDGTLWMWGIGTSGQLGTDTAINRSSPAQVGTLTNWVSISGGRNHFGGIDSSGQLWMWGSNAFGGLGINAASGSRSSPSQVGALTTWSKMGIGDYHGFAIKTDGTLWAWGNNNVGQQGRNTTVTSSSPIQVGTLTNWATVFAKAAATTTIKTDGTMWNWGTAGLLGDNANTLRSSPVQIGTLTDWAVSVVGSGTGGNAVKADGTLWGWGGNNLGQLGEGANVNRSSPVQIGTLTNWRTTPGSVMQGAGFGIAIKTDNTLWAWGLRGQGSLGDGKVSIQVSPVQIGTLTNWTGVASSTTLMLGSQQE